MADSKKIVDHYIIIIRWIAKIWSGLVILIAIFIIITFLWNLIITGKPDPYSIGEYPTVENLIPVSLFLSILGLVVSFRWEGLGGAITVFFQLATFLIHHLLLSPRPYPYILTVIIITPGILYIFCWWKTRNKKLQ